MPSDLATLAEACGVGLPEVHACLLVAGDGSVAVAHPADEQMRALAAWQGVRGLGAVRRGFVTLGQDCWAFVMREHVGALAVVAPTPRPGVVLERLDRVLDQATPALVSGAAPEGEAPLVTRPNPPGPTNEVGERSDDPSWGTDTFALVREFAGLLTETPDAEEPPPQRRDQKPADGAA